MSENLAWCAFVAYASMYDGEPSELEKGAFISGYRAGIFAGSPGLNELRDRVHALAVSKGWYENRDVSDPNVLGSMLALIHSEVSEALEDVRGGGMGLRVDGGIDWFPADEARKAKPCGLPSELADVIIRVLDLCGALGIDIEEAVRVKHAYNETRSHRHGGKAL